MPDPIETPISSEDRIYADIGAPDYTTVPNRKELSKQAVQRQIDRERNELLLTLAKPEAQALLMRVLAFCGIYHTTDGDKTAEGRRQVGLFILEMIQKADPELYPELLLNHLERQRRLKENEAAIVEEHRRKYGHLRRIVTRVADAIRPYAATIADKVW
jgi:hypothetical protein